jgi:uncharacterized RDD family membrane protein YckC
MEGKVQVSSITQRILAILIDGVLLLLVQKFFESVGILVGDEPWVWLMEFYFVFMHWCYSATLGKMVLKLRVVDSVTYSPLTLKQSFIRELPYIIDILVGYVFVRTSMDGEAWSEFMMPLFILGELLSAVLEDRNRTLSDRLARTMVVRAA